MKRIEDIERMEPEDLESAAMAEDIQVPAGLEDRIKASLAAKAAVEYTSKRSFVHLAPYAVLAVAAGLAAVTIIPKNSEAVLKDTFDDPYLAYAQVEETFKRISDKMAVGVDLAAKAGETAEMPAQIINKISK